VLKLALVAAAIAALWRLEWVLLGWWMLCSGRARAPLGDIRAEAPIAGQIVRRSSCQGCDWPPV